MYIEDIIISVVYRVPMNPYDTKILSSFYDQISRNSGLTEKQRDLALKILQRQSSKISNTLGKNIDQYLQNPVFKLEKRVISQVKKISIINDYDLYKNIKVQFPFDQKLADKLRENRNNFFKCLWDMNEKAWIISLQERSIEFFHDFSKEYGFEVDEEFQSYVDQMAEIKENLENFIPMVKIQDDVLHFSNVSPKIPQPTSENILETLFLARSYGITTWDDKINKIFENNTTHSIVKKFLDTNPTDKFEINLENDDIFHLVDIVKYMTPCLFIIPGGNEIEKLQLSLEILKKAGLDNSNVSVLFRLPKETGENFNNFVKNEKLNNPVSEKVKVMFISSKVPKTIIDPEINFNLVVNFNFYNVHYTIREFVKNHHNVINIMEKKQQRTFDFGILQSNY